MALVSLRQLLDHAAEHDYALPAFNVSNMEQMLAVMKGADTTGSPVILQASKSALAYASDIVLTHLVRAAIELYPNIPVCMHLDHGNSPASCMSAITNGFSSVMMDGSLKADGKSPADFNENVQVTAKVVEMAHLAGVSVEGEIGHLGSLETLRGEPEDGHGFEGELSREQLLTDPQEAEAFVHLTGVDALAVAIGTSHGAYKFSRKPDDKILATDRLREIHDRIPNTHLVMHGSSSVPKELQDIINDYGGEMPPTWGVPIDEIQVGIRYGVRKVNVDTDLRMAMTGAIRKALVDRPGEFDPRKYLVPGVDAMAAICRDRFEQFHAAGNASRIAPIRLVDMARRYSAAQSQRVAA